MSETFQSARPVKGATPRILRLLIPAEVSIRAPREGRDPRDSPAMLYVLRFQSARPVKGATRDLPASEKFPHKFQSARPVKGATPSIQ